MTKDYDALFQARIDELYLLEKQAQDRLNRFEAHYEHRLAAFKKQEKSAQELLRFQQDALATLNEKITAVHFWYRQVVKLGGMITGLIILGLVCLFLWWWHVDTVANDTQSLQSSIDVELKHLPYMMIHNGKTYVRIVSDAFVPDLKDAKGRSLQGDYAEVYLLRDQEK